MNRLLISAVLALFPMAALGAGWEQSFVAPSVSSYLVKADQRVMVVAAGEKTADLKAASAAFQAALRQGAQSVIDGASLGPAVDLDDPAIVARAKGMPVDVIVTLRLFPSSGSSGEGATAVVTFYDVKGALLSALSVQAGKALVPKGASEAGAGVSHAAATSVAETASKSESANSEYDEKYVHFGDGVTINAQTGAVVGTWSIPVQGKYKKPLPGATFYDAVGRPDLAARFRSKNVRRQTLMWGGAIVSLASLIYGTAYGLGSIDDCHGYEYGEPALEACEDEQAAKEKTGLIIMLGGGLGGALITGIGAMTNPHPVDAPEARRLADEYNQGLKSGIQAAAPRVTVSPYFTASSAGVGLELKF